MIKLVALLKRRPGMSTEEFVAYYEGRHAKLAERTLRGNCLRYLRRYLQPMAHPLAGETDRPSYDAIAEMWFENAERLQATMGLFAAPGTAEELAEDEKRLFDVGQTLVYTVEEHESQV